MKKRILQYGICFLIGALLACWVMNIEGLFLIDVPSEIAAILCDAFFVPGILLTMVGCLIWIATTGFFDSIGYAVKVGMHIILPFFNKGERKSYYDYKMEKDEKRGKTPIFVFIVGAFYLVLSGIALIIWMNLV